MASTSATSRPYPIVPERLIDGEQEWTAHCAENPARKSIPVFYRLQRGAAPDPEYLFRILRQNYEKMLPIARSVPHGLPLNSLVVYRVHLDPTTMMIRSDTLEELDALPFIQQHVFERRLECDIEFNSCSTKVLVVIRVPQETRLWDVGILFDENVIDAGMYAILPPTRYCFNCFKGNLPCETALFDGKNMTRAYTPKRTPNLLTRNGRSVAMVPAWAVLDGLRSAQ